MLVLLQLRIDIQINKNIHFWNRLQPRLAIQGPYRSQKSTVEFEENRIEAESQEVVLQPLPQTSLKFPFGTQATPAVGQKNRGSRDPRSMQHWLPSTETGHIFYYHNFWVTYKLLAELTDGPVICDNLLPVAPCIWRYLLF